MEIERLAADIVEAIDLHPRFFGDFPNCGLWRRLARLDSAMNGLPCSRASHASSPPEHKNVPRIIVEIE